MMMPPAANDNKLARFSAQIIGIVRAVPRMAKFRLIGEKFASASIGLPTVNRHQGTKREIVISSKVAMPPATPIQFILLCMRVYQIQVSGTLPTEMGSVC